MEQWDSHLGDCIKYEAKAVDPDMVWDAIVIGSGIGGLTTASLLAQRGQKVLVLEQHWAAGGCTHTFESEGYRFGTGIHYVGNMNEGGNFKKLLDTLTPKNDPVVWDRIEEPYERSILGAPSANYERCTSHEAFRKYLLEKFPKEEKGIDEYFRSVKEAKSAFSRSFLFKSLPFPIVQLLIWTGLHKYIDGGYSKWATISLQEALEKMTDDKELQGLLASNYVDLGTDPSRSPFIMHAGLVSSYRYGAFYPHGGPSTIASKIIKTLKANQGQVMVCANVKRIIVEKDGKINVTKGVEMSDGTVIKAKVVVSDAGLVNTATHLLPHGMIKLNLNDDHTSKHSTEQLHPAQTCLSLFVGLSGDPETFNLPKCGGIFIHPSNDLKGNSEKVEKMTIQYALGEDSIDETMEGEALHLGPIFVAFSCLHDKSWSQTYPGKSVIEVCAMCPYSWFANYESNKGKEYEQMKTRLADKIWQRVVEVLEVECPALPKGLEGMDHFRVGTPLTMSRFIGSEHGAMYGLDHNMKRFEPSMHYLRLRPKVPEVSGLFLTGQDVATAGFVSAMSGGLLCAASVLKVADPFSLIQRSDDDPAVRSRL